MDTFAKETVRGALGNEVLLSLLEAARAYL
jgi:hypothetical protein